MIYSIRFDNNNGINVKPHHHAEVLYYWVLLGRILPYSLRKWIKKNGVLVFQSVSVPMRCMYVAPFDVLFIHLYYCYVHCMIVVCCVLCSLTILNYVLYSPLLLKLLRLFRSLTVSSLSIFWRTRDTFINLLISTSTCCTVC